MQDLFVLYEAVLSMQLTVLHGTHWVPSGISKDPALAQYFIYAPGEATCLASNRAKIP